MPPITGEDVFMFNDMPENDDRSKSPRGDSRERKSKSPVDNDSDKGYNPNM
jgi:hypothetical protein